MGLEAVLSKVQHGLIVSCQALPDEPLHGSDSMVKMARAAQQGGAVVDSRQWRRRCACDQTGAFPASHRPDQAGL